MEVICYATGRKEAPQDSIKGMEHCQSIDLEWWIEMNIQLTKDERLILFHDDIINLNGVMRKIKELNFEELSNHDIGAGEKIPLLSEALSKFCKTKFVFDIHAHTSKVVDVFIANVESSNYEGDFIVASEDGKITELIKSKRPKWKFAAATREVKRVAYSSMFRLERFFVLKSDYLFMPLYYNGRKILNHRIVKMVKKLDKKICVWLSETGETKTVDSLKDYDLLSSFGVDGILTDRPAYLKELLTQRSKKNDE